MMTLMSQCPEHGRRLNGFRDVTVVADPVFDTSVVVIRCVGHLNKVHLLSEECALADAIVAGGAALELVDR